MPDGPRRRKEQQEDKKKNKKNGQQEENNERDEKPTVSLNDQPRGRFDTTGRRTKNKNAARGHAQPGEHFSGP
ncbi:hypothetical protein HUE56_10115 [Azospirillum oryzae]|uniref:Uncharacterized protein n=1 Tax=Azospirillum oryzae TaxID=286727 RepID=A0A6N1AHD7_9PROT|nr:hypothetical protein [Azospirillum oryzae]KAA0586006.1 hypothetical protein FZ938_23040 [Azospirillum oryzae]QKS50883.1 hypothetical protein HUE56_10115 [Azospirillum oryzae]